MTSKKHLLLAQALISFKMAALMNGIFSFMALGFTREWLYSWSTNFIVAWPIAFCLSLPVSKIAFSLAGRLTAKRAA